jgi:hypothetical protein
METNPLFGYLHAQIRQGHLKYDASERGAFVRDYACYYFYFTGAPAQVESPRGPNAD